MKDLFEDTHPPETAIEVPEWFERLVPPGNPTEGYSDKLFEMTFDGVKAYKEIDPAVFDKIWWDVYKSYDIRTTYDDPEKIRDALSFTKGTGKIVGHGFFVYEVMFLNLGKVWWPFAIYADPMTAFMEAMFSPMFRGPGGFLVCRYAARSIDTGRRYIPFRDQPPEPE